ncbi:MAG TPA: DUF4062 domain-containing protein [Bradyrhizobium sp.]|nr:DUF4062 domain-containing protein [Bradyrhizobium sp.]
MRHRIVMISSTTLDLSKHRDQVRLACERAGFEPRQMMENLTAEDASAIEVSLRMVEEADIYICILAHRYGTIPLGHDISITEMEYNRAVDTGKQRLIFFASNNHETITGDPETDLAAKKLEALKDRIRQDRVVAFFKSPDDLRSHVIEALIKLPPKRSMRRSPAAERFFPQAGIESRNRSGRSTINPELKQFLDSIGVEPSALGAPHPTEISHAIGEYKRKWADLLPGSRSIDVLVSISEYPSIFPSDFQEKHDQYYEFLRRLGLYYPEMGTFRAKNQEFVGSRLTDQTLAQNKKVILASSFFYQTSSRKDLWGVIPVGRQEAFGLIMPRALYKAIFGEQNPLELVTVSTRVDDLLASSLRQLPGRLTLKIDLFGTNWAHESTLWFLERIVRHLAVNDGTIYVRRGYIQGDLLTGFLSRSPLSSMNSRLQDMIVFPKGNDESNFPLFSAEGTDLDEESVDRTKTCALFDLGQIDKIISGICNSKSVCDDYLLFTVRHGLTVPVGIGFSLPLLPYLLKKSSFGNDGKEVFLYETMRKAAINLYIGDREQKRVDEFLEIGIDLTEATTELS